MTDNMNQEMLDLLKQIQQNLGESSRIQLELSERVNALDRRLLQVERCLINLRNDTQQSRNRTVWSDDERTAFSNWLTTNAVIDDEFPKF